MKIIMITPPWIGGLFENITIAFRSAGNEVFSMGYKEERTFANLIKAGGFYINRVSKQAVCNQNEN